ncbi:transcriptional repressor [Candidatus Saccharibacteria bacterium CPR2]|nr:transcriptional repressor [Candidatus Saccharibacteria bacterium CPR2]
MKMQNVQFEESVKNQLKISGLSVTTPRMNIAKILFLENKPMSIREIIRKTGKTAHFVTIYRTIDTLVKAKVLNQINIGFKNKYELSDMFRPHHHHAICEVCGQSTEIQNKKIEATLNSITEDAGLKPTRHQFELYGICSKCINEKQ